MELAASFDEALDSEEESSSGVDSEEEARQI